MDERSSSQEKERDEEKGGRQRRRKVEDKEKNEKRKDCVSVIISIKTHTIICFASEEDVSVQPLTSSGTHCSCWMMCPVDTLASFNHTPRSRGPGEAGRHHQPLWSHPSQFPSHSHHCSRPMSPAGRRLFFRWCTPTSRSAYLKQTHPLSLF